MLGTNKTGTTKRLVGSTYETFLASVAYRYQPVKYQDYTTKAKHIAFKLFCDIYDIKPADRLVEGDREFVIAGAAKYTDALGQHLEVLMREVHSEMHTVVTRKALTETQGNYDPIFEERVAGKDYASQTMSVLLDPIEASKEAFIKMLDSGKLEEIDYIMTVDFPDKVAKEDRIMFDGVEYEVKRIVPHPFQYLVGLRKSMVNYFDN